MPRPDMSRVGVSAAMRARDVSRPSPEDVRVAEEAYDSGRGRRERRRTHRGGQLPKIDRSPEADRPRAADRSEETGRQPRTSSRRRS